MAHQSKRVKAKVLRRIWVSKRLQQIKTQCSRDDLRGINCAVLTVTIAERLPLREGDACQEHIFGTLFEQSLWGYAANGRNSQLSGFRTRAGKSTSRDYVERAPSLLL